MLCAFICLLAVSGAPAPTIPAGTSAEFQKLYADVIKATASGDFAHAQQLAGLLPKQKIVIQWDDKNVPESYKASYIDARDRAIGLWTQFMPAVTFTYGTKPDIKFSFEKSVGNTQGEKEPPAAVLFFGVSPQDPRVESVIALERGLPLSQTEVSDVNNEVAYALGQYFGLARTPNFGGYSSRTEQQTSMMVRPTPSELNLAKVLMQITDLVRKSITQRTAMSWSPPRATIDKDYFDLGTVHQGEIRNFSIQLNNIGKGQLHASMIPDCGCVTPAKIAPLEAEQSKLIPISVDSTDFIGEQHKSIMLYTNDSEMPTREIKIRLNIIPSYRFLVPEGENINLDFNGGTRDVYLVLPEGSDIVPENHRFDGVPAKVSYVPWEGELADPVLNEPAKKRKGYKFTIAVEPGVYVGRNMASLVVTTKSKRFPELRLIMSVQIGIVASPERLTLGQIAKGPKRASFLVTRPNSEFEIVKIETGSPYLTATYKPVRDKSEYKVTIQYDGKSADPRLESTIKVYTNDPRYTVISVPFTAIQR